MLKSYRYSELDDPAINALTERKLPDDSNVREICMDIGEKIRRDGDSALREYSRQFDGVELASINIPEADIESARTKIAPELRDAITFAYDNIRRFHELQIPDRSEAETLPGVRVWREFRPLDRAGLYIPGGSAPLFSTVLMLGIPATIAGCKDIVLCTPPDKTGGVAPEILFAAELMGITQIFRVGGAQAIFAMAYGTETIGKVDKIFGPGNRFVTTAKQIAQSTVAIDMPAGPSEVLVIADAQANPAFIAADLLSQAEHGADSQAILVTDAKEIISHVNDELKKQLLDLPRGEIARKALANSFTIETENILEAIEFSNRYAPEHLILHLEKWEERLPMIMNAGSVFCGAYSPESVGDFASGTNHVLPTSGFARNHSGVSVESFGKWMTFQHLTQKGLDIIGPPVELMATAEGLAAHQRAVAIRS